MNREVLRIALPNIISNITVPLMGLVSTAIAGRCGVDSAITIGQLAIGISVFNMIYWNCNFIRMGTSGVTAQAFGAEDFDESSRILLRSTIIALLLGALLLLVREPLSRFAINFMGGSEMSLEYVRVRFWAIPAGILLFALHGWFTGMQSGVHSMVVAICVNLTHICVSLYLALYRGMGIVGIAYASIIAQWGGVLIAMAILRLRYSTRLRGVSLGEVFNLPSIRKFFRINTDIIIRTLCVVCVYTYFTRASSMLGDSDIFAVNVLLMQLFTLYSYISDGFAYAAEALVGRFVGAADEVSLRRVVALSLRWGVVVALIFLGVYLVWWREILSMFIGEGGDVATMLTIASRYIGWIVLIPIAGVLPVIIDGMMVGAGFTNVMRNSMILSAATFFTLYFTFEPMMGNNALWLAFTTFILMRGVLQYFMTSRLRTLYSLTLR